jgi:hypothetical protein
LDFRVLTVVPSLETLRTVVVLFVVGVRLWSIVVLGILAVVLPLVIEGLGRGLDPVKVYVIVDICSRH